MKVKGGVESPPGVSTNTWTGPAAWAGVVNVRLSPLGSTVAGKSTPSTNTSVSPTTNPVPVIVTSVPPAIGPMAGDSPDVVGTGRYVKVSGV